MIKKLKRKFITLSMIALLLLLILVVAGMNIINYFSVVRESDELLSLLSNNKGHFPEFNGDRFDKLPPDMSPETPYQTRYFSVLIGSGGEILQTDTTRIASVDTELAEEYGISVMKKSAERGFQGNFRYVKIFEKGSTRLIFLDSSRELDSLRRFMLSSIAMAIFGYAIIFVAVVFFSGRIVRPVAESYDKQKRFITDAGHELKTPLSIITAHVNLMEMELGQQESLDEIINQTKRLTDLTNNLVYLSKMEETQDALALMDFPISEVIEESVQPFHVLAGAQGKKLECSIEPMITVRGNDRAVSQLVNILLDNALKYSPDASRISLSLKKRGKSAILSVTNPTREALPVESLARMFERFYRADVSRNSKTGGYGIGLSIAKAIVSAHNGKIVAQAANENELCITVELPI